MAPHCLEKNLRIKVQSKIYVLLMRLCIPACIKTGEEKHREIMYLVVVCLFRECRMLRGYLFVCFCLNGCPVRENLRCFVIRKVEIRRKRRKVMYERKRVYYNATVKLVSLLQCSFVVYHNVISNVYMN